jgi:ornithine carbamoyltransferase
MGARHFLSSDDLSVAEQATIIERARELKASRGSHPMPLANKTIALIFEKPSTRTRVSFETAITEMGAHALVLRGDELQLGRGETLEDTARVMSRYVHAIVVRTFGQDRLEDLAEGATIPVVNALSDAEHPCQALADVMTVVERFEDPSEIQFTYLGDGNNVCHSLLLAGAKAGIGRIEVATPPGFEPIEPVVERASAIGETTGTRINVGNDPAAACKRTQVLYTDVWTSMGQEGEQAHRVEAFRGFDLSEERLGDADSHAIVMHCLPAHRGEEIAAEVIDGPHSAVWDQAENRLHTQKALLAFLLADRKKEPKK